MGEAPGGYSFRECRFCRAAYENEVTGTPPNVLIGRSRSYVNHLARCTPFQNAHLPPVLTPVLSTPAAPSQERPALSFEVTPELRPDHTEMTQFLFDRVLESQDNLGLVEHSRSANTPPPRDAPPSWQKNTVGKKTEEAKAQASAIFYLPDRFVEKTSVRRLFELVCPGISAILPSRRTLGKRIRQEHAHRCKTMDMKALKEMMETTEGWVNLLSDVWQNISKDHLLGCQLSLFCVLLTYGLLPAGDENHGIAIFKRLEQVLEQTQEENWRIGAIITDNAGQCGRARRILGLRRPNIVFFILFRARLEQFGQSSVTDVAARAATAVNVLNAASSKWQPRTRQMMKKCYGKALGLPLQMFYRRYQSYTDFPTRLQAFGDPLFWDALKEAEAIIAPLSYASYRLQRDENTLGDVVLSFRDIRREFQKHLALVDCVETRWAPCEQPLFMLGFALHLLYAETARELPNTAVSGIGSLGKAVMYYYRRLLSTDDIGQIRRGMVAWMTDRLTRQKASESEGSPWEFWESVGMHFVKARDAAVNTATCERLFSELGAIHTTKRNRMDALKALDFQIIAQHVRQQELKQDSHERQIISDVVSSASLFSRSPQREAINEDEDSDGEDPGDNVDGNPTLLMWGEYLDKVFEDDKIDADHTATRSTYTPTNRAPASRTINELEEIAEAVKPNFTDHNDRNFPQEASALQGFRGQKATLADLFG
ncbi:hypothetical protein GN958_ATG14597 [Phytophthora infestans]|uniref:HAT C-terminal dimerisation domain-containing protein n=1 Tax=Phytophthora infestans TaxID=4787 RepID=A0A8S9U9J2_PHYIN|nr:hypothetical protein GN958_ATG14597 [Phytophthora infestans]